MRSLRGARIHWNADQDWRRGLTEAAIAPKAASPLAIPVQAPTLPHRSVHLGFLHVEGEISEPAFVPAPRILPHDVRCSFGRVLGDQAWTLPLENRNLN